MALHRRMPMSVGTRIRDTAPRLSCLMFCVSLDQKRAAEQERQRDGALVPLQDQCYTQRHGHNEGNVVYRSQCRPYVGIDTHVQTWDKGQHHNLSVDAGIDQTNRAYTCLATGAAHPWLNTPHTMSLNRHGFKAPIHQ